jgi:hypothetical protein
MAQRMEALQREINKENCAKEREEREKEERERVECKELEQEWVKKEKMEREIHERRLAYEANQTAHAGKTEMEASKRKGKERPQVTMEVRGGEVKAKGGSKTPAAVVPGYYESEFTRIRSYHPRFRAFLSFIHSFIHSFIVYDRGKLWFPTKSGNLFFKNQ